MNRQHIKLEKSIKALKKLEHKGHNITDELGLLHMQKEENLQTAVILIHHDDISDEYGDGGGMVNSPESYEDDNCDSFNSL
jgi:hypothetical protein